MSNNIILIMVALCVIVSGCVSNQEGKTGNDQGVMFPPDTGGQPGERG